MAGAGPRILSSQDNTEYDVDWWSKLFWATGMEQKAQEYKFKDYFALQVW